MSSGKKQKRAASPVSPVSPLSPDPGSTVIDLTQDDPHRPKKKFLQKASSAASSASSSALGKRGQTAAEPIEIGDDENKEPSQRPIARMKPQAQSLTYGSAPSKKDAPSSPSLYTIPEFKPNFGSAAPDPSVTKQDSPTAPQSSAKKTRFQGGFKDPHTNNDDDMRDTTETEIPSSKGEKSAAPSFKWEASTTPNPFTREGSAAPFKREGSAAPTSKREGSAAPLKRKGSAAPLKRKGSAAPTLSARVESVPRFVLNESDEETGSDENMSGNELGPDPNLTRDPEDIWSPEMAREASGISDGEIEVNYYKKIGYSYRLLTERGPRNAKSYRLERERDVDYPFDELDTLDLTDIRLGEKRSPDKSYMYKRVHARAIQGIAPFIDGKKVPYDAIWEDIHNELRPKPKKPGGPRPMDVQILVKWFKDGNWEKSWETRTTIRRLWGHEKGDKVIWDAFKTQELRYKEYLDGERPAKDRSPTPNRHGFTPEPESNGDQTNDNGYLRPESAKQVPRSRKESSSPTPEVRPKSTSPTPEPQAQPTLSISESRTQTSPDDIETIRAAYCKEVLNLNDPGKMTPLNNIAFKAWFQKNIG